jgi:hypothetical protein
MPILPQSLFYGIDDQSLNYSSLLNWWNQQLKPWFINLFKKLFPI